MKKFLFPIALVALTVSCNNNNDKPLEDGKITSVSEMEAVGQQMEAAINESSARREARVSKGDTVAMPYKSLQEYLPQEIEGYTREGGPSGNQMNIPGMGSWSEAEQQYVSGDKRLEIKIVDYNSAMGAFTGVTSLYRMGFSSEDDYKREGSVDLGIRDVSAYETVYKNDPRSSLVMIIADRFFVSLENDGEQDATVLHRVAKKMNISGLAEK